MAAAVAEAERSWSPRSACPAVHYCSLMSPGRENLDLDPHLLQESFRVDEVERSISASVGLR